MVPPEKRRLISKSKKRAAGHPKPGPSHMCSVARSWHPIGLGECWPIWARPDLGEDGEFVTVLEVENFVEWKKSMEIYDSLT